MSIFAVRLVILTAESRRQALTPSLTKADRASRVVRLSPACTRPCLAPSTVTGVGRLAVQADTFKANRMAWVRLASSLIFLARSDVPVGRARSLLGDAARGDAPHRSGRPRKDLRSPRSFQRHPWPPRRLRWRRVCRRPVGQKRRLSPAGLSDRGESCSSVTSRCG